MGLTLTDGILELAQEQDLGTASMRRVKAAIRTLERELGQVSFTSAEGRLELAQKVRVPGDDAVWVVFGEWGDGTMDVIREEGSFPKDVLVGWTPGQHIRDYWKEVRELPDAPLAVEKKRVAPLFHRAPVPG